MARAHMWWKANAFLVALTLRVLFSIQPVIFAERASSPNGGCKDQSRPSASARTRWRRISNFATANEGAARRLFTMMVVLLLSCVGFGTYWHWSDEMALTNGIIASSNCHQQNCAKSKRALRMEVIGGFALPLLVTVAIYLYRWDNRAMIRSLNRNFKTIYHSQQNGRDGQWQRSCWEQYGQLATKQVFEVMALAVLWLNLRPFSHTKHAGDGGDYHVGKLISSTASMLPAIVCLLVSIEMGINFSLLTRTLSTLNMSLNCYVRCISDGDYRKRVNRGNNMMQAQYIHRTNRSMTGKTKKCSYLRNLVVQFDELGQFMVDMVEFYAPVLLCIIGMHFVLFTMQVCLESFCFYSVFKRFKLLALLFHFIMFTFTTLSSLCMNLLSVLCNFHSLDEYTVSILGRLAAAAHCKVRNIIQTYDAKELDKCVTSLCLIVNRIRDGTNLYGYFDLDRSFVMTIIASTCSYLIVLIQVM
uniref:Gustatory receptor n=1 Tax=Anopheles minimus TaxID=112268 RepID=A0A182WAU5_9DIPT